MTSALILAAGFGTRLRPLTLELPKPVVPVGDRPLLAHVAAACRRGGATRLVANAHHKHVKLSNIIQELQLDIEVIVEDQIRGTAGGVTGARSRFEAGAVLVWNGDILTQAPVHELLAVANERDEQVLAVSPRRVGVGTVGMDESGAVVRLRGQVFGLETQSGDYIGVQALGPRVLASLPREGCLFGDVALPHLGKGGRVGTVPSAAPWSDLGDLAAYVTANFAWLDSLEPPTSNWIAPTASIAPGITINRSLLGLRAKVTGAGAVTDVIAWPGAPVVAPLSRAVVLTSGRVVPFDSAAEN